MAEEKKPETVQPEEKAQTKAPDISSQIDQARREAMNMKTKQIYTMVDAEMEALGFEKAENEKTMDAYRRLMGEFATLRAKANAKQPEQEATPAKISDDEKAVYEAKIKELSETLGTKNSELEKRIQELQAVQLRQRVSGSFDSSKIAVPQGLSEEAAVKYRESIKNTIVRELEGLERKATDGKQYIYIDGKPQIDQTTLEPKSEAQIAREMFGHFFVTEKHPNNDQLDVMTDEQKQAVIKKMSVKTMQDAKALAAKEHKRNSPEWAKRVNEIAKAHGLVK